MLLHISCDALGHIISDVTWGPQVFLVFQQSYTLAQATQPG